MRRVATLLAAAGLLQAQSALAADAPTCVPRADATDLITFMLPALVDGLAIKCRPLLPGDAFLASPGAQALATRLKPASQAAWPGAKRVAESTGQGQLAGFLSDDVEQGVVEQLTATAVVAGVPPSDCPLISEAAELIQPLPGRNIGALATLFLANDKRAQALPFRLCEGATGR